MSSPSPRLPPVEIRAPWADELPRLSAAFPRLPWNRPLHLRVMVTQTTPARLVGIAAIAPAKQGQVDATFHWPVRPRYQSDRLHLALAQALLSQHSQTVIAPKPTKPEDAADLHTLGFTATTPDGHLLRPAPTA